MIDMVMRSSKPFFAGKLFRDNKIAMRQLTMGADLGALVIVAVARVAPLRAAAIVAGAVAGVLQPILFKNLKQA